MKSAQNAAHTEVDAMCMGRAEELAGVEDEDEGKRIDTAPNAIQPRYAAMTMQRIIVRSYLRADRRCWCVAEWAVIYLRLQVSESFQRMRDELFRMEACLVVSPLQDEVFDRSDGGFAWEGLQLLVIGEIRIRAIVN